MRDRFHLIASIHGCFNFLKCVIEALYSRLNKVRRNHIVNESFIKASEHDRRLIIGWHIKEYSLNLNNLIYKRHYKTIKFLLQNGLDVEIKNTWSSTPLHVAVQRQRSKL